MTLHEAFARYRSDVIVFRNLSPKTEQNNYAAEYSLVRCITKPIEHLDMSDIRKWSKRQSCSSNTCREYLLQLRVVLRHIRGEGIKCLDPTLVLLPKRTQSLIHVITPKEITKLIEACNANRNRLNRLRNQTIISLLYASGLRVSEMCSLDRDSIVDNRFAVVGKGGKIRPCLIDARTRDLLTKYLKLRTDSNPALFISFTTHMRMNAGAVQEVFRHVAKRAGLENVHPHTLRHTYATNLMSNGMHIYTLSRLMGHSSIQTTSVYLHYSDKQLEQEYNTYHSI